MVDLAPRSTFRARDAKFSELTKPARSSWPDATTHSSPVRPLAGTAGDPAAVSFGFGLAGTAVKAVKVWWV